MKEIKLNIKINAEIVHVDRLNILTIDILTMLILPNLIYDL